MEYFQELNNWFYSKLIFVDNRRRNNHVDLIQDFLLQDHLEMQVEEVFEVIRKVQYRNRREEFSIDKYGNMFPWVIDYQEKVVKV
jgi:hypothetical protein